MPYIKLSKLNCIEFEMRVYEAINNMIKRKVFANAVILGSLAKRLIENISLSWNEKYLLDVAIIERESVYVKDKPLVFN